MQYFNENLKKNWFLSLKMVDKNFFLKNFLKWSINTYCHEQISPRKTTLAPSEVCVNCWTVLVYFYWKMAHLRKISKLDINYKKNFFLVLAVDMSSGTLKLLGKIVKTKKTILENFGVASLLPSHSARVGGGGGVRILLKLVVIGLLGCESPI